MKDRITSTKEVRARFWRENPGLDRQKVKDFEGTGLMYKTDTRVAFVDFVDALHREGVISDRLAQNVTLD